MHKSLPARTRSRSQGRNLSIDVTQFIKKQYPTKTPIPMITGISKLYCKNKPTTKDSKIIQRLAQNPTQVNTARFVEYLSTDNSFKKGNHVTDLQIKRSYQSSCNPEGKLTFEYLMKLSENTGMQLNEKLAKAIVKKYGKGKDFLNMDDCQRVIKRRYTNLAMQVLPQSSPRYNFNKK